MADPSDCNCDTVTALRRRVLDVEAENFALMEGTKRMAERMVALRDEFAWFKRANLEAGDGECQESYDAGKLQADSDAIRRVAKLEEGIRGVADLFRCAEGNRLLTKDAQYQMRMAAITVSALLKETT